MTSNLKCPLVSFVLADAYVQAKKYSDSLISDSKLYSYSIAKCNRTRRGVKSKTYGNQPISLYVDIYKQSIPIEMIGVKQISSPYMQALFTKSVQQFLLAIETAPVQQNLLFALKLHQLVYYNSNSYVDYSQTSPLTFSVRVKRIADNEILGDCIPVTELKGDQTCHVEDVEQFWVKEMEIKCGRQLSHLLGYRVNLEHPNLAFFVTVDEATKELRLSLKLRSIKAEEIVEKLKEIGSIHTVQESKEFELIKAFQHNLFNIFMFEREPQVSVEEIKRIHREPQTEYSREAIERGLIMREKRNLPTFQYKLQYLQLLPLSLFYTTIHSPSTLLLSPATVEEILFRSLRSLFCYVNLNTVYSPTANGNSQHFGTTSLTYACQNGLWETTNLLIELGSHSDLRDSNGKNAYLYCIERGDVNSLALLVKYRQVKKEIYQECMLTAQRNAQYHCLQVLLHRVSRCNGLRLQEIALSTVKNAVLTADIISLSLVFEYGSRQMYKEAPQVCKELLELALKARSTHCFALLIQAGIFLPLVQTASVSLTPLPPSNRNLYLTDHQYHLELMKFLAAHASDKKYNSAEKDVKHIERLVKRNRIRLKEKKNKLRNIAIQNSKFSSYASKSSNTSAATTELSVYRGVLNDMAPPYYLQHKQKIANTVLLAVDKMPTILHNERLSTTSSLKLYMPTSSVELIIDYLCP